MKAIYRNWYMNSICIFLLLGIISSCSKDQGPIPFADPVMITVTGFSTDPEAAFTVKVNGEVVSDSVYSGLTMSKIVTRKDGLQQITVSSKSTGALLIDTLIEIKNKEATIKLLQLDPSRPPQIIGQEEDDLPADKHRLAFYYTDHLLPDSLIAEVYYCWYNPDTYEFEKIRDTARYDKIKKGVLSEFQLMSGDGITSNAVHMLELFNAVTGERLSGLAAPFDPVIFSGYYTDFTPGATGTEKNYINRIVTSGSQDFFDIYSDRMISY